MDWTLFTAAVSVVFGVSTPLFVVKIKTNDIDTNNTANFFIDGASLVIQLFYSNI